MTSTGGKLRDAKLTACARLFTDERDGDEWGDAFKPGLPVFVFAGRMLIEDIVEGQGGRVADEDSDDPAVADGTADFCWVNDPLGVVDVAGAIEEGADLFGDGIELYGDC
jgi:hypothetical protein